MLADCSVMRRVHQAGGRDIDALSPRLGDTFNRQLPCKTIYASASAVTQSCRTRSACWLRVYERLALRIVDFCLVKGRYFAVLPRDVVHPNKVVYAVANPSVRHTRDSCQNG